LQKNFSEDLMMDILKHIKEDYYTPGEIILGENNSLFYGVLSEGVAEVVYRHDTNE